MSFYELRLLIGHESSGVKYSYWFLMFFGFMFLGLALLKRHNEALLAAEGKTDDVPERPYSRSESSILSMIGISCGIAAVLILALYVHSDEVQLVYQNPYYLAAWCPIILFLLSRMWTSVVREQLDQDPVIHLLKDPITYWLTALGGIVTYLAV